MLSKGLLGRGGWLGLSLKVVLKDLMLLLGKTRFDISADLNDGSRGPRMANGLRHGWRVHCVGADRSRLMVDNGAGSGPLRVGPRAVHGPGGLTVVASGWEELEAPPKR